MSRSHTEGMRFSGRTAFWIGVAFLVLLFVFLQWLRAGEPLGMDQGLFACFGRWIGWERVPYRDLWDSKPPLALYVYPFAFLLFGTHTGSIWLAEGLLLAAAMFVAHRIGRALAGPGCGLLAALFLLTGTWAPEWGGYWARAQAEEFLMLPLLGAAWAAGRTSRWAAGALATGLLTGTAGLFKVPALILLVAWPAGWAIGAGSRRLAARTALLLAGAAIPWVLAAVWFAAHGALGAMWEAAFVYNRHYAAAIAAGAPLGSVLLRFGAMLFAAAPAATLAAPAGLLLLALERSDRGAWLGPWLLLSAGAVVAQRQLAGYHFLLLVPALALAAAYAVTALARAALAGPAPRRALAAAALFGLTLLAAGEAADWRRAYADDLALAAGRLDRPTYLQRLGSGPFSPATEEAVATYLAAHTHPGDGILVWGLSPGIYFLADRHPVTRFPFHHLLLTDAPLSRRFGSLGARRSAFLERLRRDPPAYILVGTRDRNGFEPEDSMTQLLRFPELRAFVFSRYEEDRTIGNFRLFRRREESRAAAVNMS